MAVSVESAPKFELKRSIDVDFRLIISAKPWAKMRTIKPPPRAVLIPKRAYRPIKGARLRLKGLHVDRMNSGRRAERSPVGLI